MSLCVVLRHGDLCDENEATRLHAIHYNLDPFASRIRGTNDITEWVMPDEVHMQRLARAVLITFSADGWVYLIGSVGD